MQNLKTSTVYCILSYDVSKQVVIMVSDGNG